MNKERIQYKKEVGFLENKENKLELYDSHTAPNIMPVIVNSSNKVVICKINNIEEVKSALVHILPHRVLILQICMEYGKEREQIINCIHETCYKRNIQPEQVNEHTWVIDDNYKACSKRENNKQRNEIDEY